MKIKRFLHVTLLALVVVMLGISLAACKLPASSGVEDEKPTEASQPPSETEPSEIEVAATATAQATAVQITGGESQPAVITETPEPVKPTKEPKAYVEATPGIPTTHVLKYGEFPFCIARRFNINQYELLALNGLGVNSATYVGMTLKIPQTGNPFDGQVWLKAHPADYYIKAGDTLEIIACKFGDVSPELIALQNNLKTPYTLTVGQKLVIP